MTIFGETTKNKHEVGSYRVVKEFVLTPTTVIDKNGDKITVVLEDIKILQRKKKNKWKDIKKYASNVKKKYIITVASGKDPIVVRHPVAQEVKRKSATMRKPKMKLVTKAVAKKTVAKKTPVKKATVKKTTASKEVNASPEAS